jgi:flagellar basal-body rod modification protein FlgD
MTDAVSATSGRTTTWADNKTAPTAADQSLGKDAFLKLLVAQLKYQDPSNPADSSQFMSQTAQFTMVERMEELLTTSNSQSAISLVGRTITWNDSLGLEQTGEVTGVTISGGKAVLEVGDETVALEAVMRVRATPAATTGTTTTG